MFFGLLWVVSYQKGKVCMLKTNSGRVTQWDFHTENEGKRKDTTLGRHRRVFRGTWKKKSKKEKMQKLKSCFEFTLATRSCFPPRPFCVLVFHVFLEE